MTPIKKEITQQSSFSEKSSDEGIVYPALSPYNLSVFKRILGITENLLPNSKEEKTSEYLDQKKAIKFSEGEESEVLCVAHKVLRKSNKMGFLSDNNLARVQIFPGPSKEQLDEYLIIWDLLNAKITEQRDLVEKAFAGHRVKNNFTHAWISAQSAQKTRLGNCHELSCFCLFYLMERTEEKIDIYMILNGNHTFTVIGRAVDSCPSDYKTWGEKAIICDLWTGKCFPAKEMPQHLCCIEETEENGLVRQFPFDPSTHQLYLRTTNYYSPKEFDELIGSSKDELTSYLRELLNHFCDTTIVEKRVEIAKKIISYTFPTRLGNYATSSKEKALNNLYCQMNHYVALKERRIAFCPSKKSP